jgi:hypothetical protein
MSRRVRNLGKYFARVWGWKLIGRMFHFGGSTHCVLFRKGVKVSGFPEPSDHNVPVRSRLCHLE